MLQNVFNNAESVKCRFISKHKHTSSLMHIAKGVKVEELSITQDTLHNNEYNKFLNMRLLINTNTTKHRSTPEK
jgi:hypothetical protein